MQLAKEKLFDPVIARFPLDPTTEDLLPSFLGGVFPVQQVEENGEYQTPLLLIGPVPPGLRISCRVSRQAARLFSGFPQRDGPGRSTTRLTTTSRSDSRVVFLQCDLRYEDQLPDALYNLLALLEHAHGTAGAPPASQPE